jgi:hypothetical protein
MSNLESVGEAAAQVNYILSPADREIWKVISRRRGAAQAITIEDIARLIWPNEWSQSEGHRASIARGIKASVRRLRRAGFKIGASRQNPPGFFAITNARELADTVRPLMRQAIDQLQTIESLTGKQYYVRELAGQMRLFGN